MPVRNQYKAAKGEGEFPRRKEFVGDPAHWTPEENPPPTTQRGRRRFEQTVEYKENLSARMSQTCPCKPSRDTYKGPSHRGKSVGSSLWKDAMEHPKDYIWVHGVPELIEKR